MDFRASTCTLFVLTRRDDIRANNGLDYLTYLYIHPEFSVCNHLKLHESNREINVMPSKNAYMGTIDFIGLRSETEEPPYTPYEPDSQESSGSSACESLIRHQSDKSRHACGDCLSWSNNAWIGIHVVNRHTSNLKQI